MKAWPFRVMALTVNAPVDNLSLPFQMVREAFCRLGFAMRVVVRRGGLAVLCSLGAWFLWCNVVRNGFIVYTVVWLCC